MVEDELDKLNEAILASEGWAPTYFKTPQDHAKLIKLTAKLERLIVQHYKNLAAKIPTMIDWYQYRLAVVEQQGNTMRADSVQAYNVQVIINQDEVDNADQPFIQITFDTMSAIQVAGVASAANSLGGDTALDTTSSIIQRLTTEQLANLVGKRVTKDGRVIDNPNSAYNIDETTRERIAQSIKTSINLGESQEDAMARLSDIIDNDTRAAMIARTEAVRGFATGRNEYASENGFGFKYWVTAGAHDICLDNEGQGSIPIDEDFASGDPFEPAHPNCQCQVIYTRTESES